MGKRVLSDDPAKIKQREAMARWRARKRGDLPPPPRLTEDEKRANRRARYKEKKLRLGVVVVPRVRRETPKQCSRAEATPCPVYSDLLGRARGNQDVAGAAWLLVAVDGLSHAEAVKQAWREEYRMFGHYRPEVSAIDARYLDTLDETAGDCDEEDELETAMWIS